MKVRGSESAGLTDLPEGIDNTLVRALALARLGLQARLDDVGGRGEVGGGHAGSGCGSERLAVGEDLAVAAFVEDVLLQVGIAVQTRKSASRSAREKRRATQRREVDGGEGDVATQARDRSLVQAEETERLDNLRSALPRRAGDLGVLALHLETDLDDLERVGEDLRTENESAVKANERARTSNARLGNHQRDHQRAAPISA